MRITKKALLTRLSTFASLSGQRLAAGPLDIGGLSLSSNMGFYSVEKISNDAGGVTVLFSGTPSQVDAWLHGAIYAFDRPRRIAAGFEAA